MREHGDGFEPLCFFDGVFQRLAVAVFDHPVVIGTRFRGEVLALLHAFGGDVDGRVVHDRTGEAALLRDLRIVDVFEAVELAATEIVIQAERVADFVQAEVIEGFFEQAVHLDAVAPLQAQHGLAKLEAIAGGGDGIAEMGIKGLGFACRLGTCAEIGKELLGQEALGDEAVLQHDVRADDFTSARVGKAGPVAAEGGIHAASPAQDVVLDVISVPPGIVGHLFDDDGVFEPGGFKGFIPLEYGGANGVAEFDGRGVLDPEHDRLHRLAQRGAGLLLHQAPAVDDVTVRGHVRAGHVGDLVREIADAWVVDARLVITLWHGDERVLHLHGDVARVGHIGSAVPGRRGIFKDVLGRDGGVFGVAVDAQNLGLGFRELAQHGFVAAAVAEFHLGEVLAQEEVGAGDEIAVIVLCGDALGVQDGAAGVGLIGLGEGILRIEIELGVLLDEFDAVKNLAQREDQGVAVTSTVVPRSHRAIHAVIEVDELRAELVLGDKQPRVAVVKVQVGAEEAVNAFEALSEFSHRFALGFVVSIAPGLGGGLWCCSRGGCWSWCSRLGWRIVGCGRRRCWGGFGRLWLRGLRFRFGLGLRFSWLRLAGVWLGWRWFGFRLGRSRRQAGKGEEQGGAGNQEAARHDKRHGGW